MPYARRWPGIDPNKLQKTRTSSTVRSGCARAAHRICDRASPSRFTLLTRRSSLPGQATATAHPSVSIVHNRPRWVTLCSGPAGTARTRRRKARIGSSPATRTRLDPQPNATMALSAKSGRCSQHLIRVLIVILPQCSPCPAGGNHRPTPHQHKRRPRRRMRCCGLQRTLNHGLHGVAERLGTPERRAFLRGSRQVL